MTQEEVALELLRAIARHEYKIDRSDGGIIADSDWVLENYARCLRTVKAANLRDGDYVGTTTT